MAPVADALTIVTTGSFKWPRRVSSYMFLFSRHHAGNSAGFRHLKLPCSHQDWERSVPNGASQTYQNSYKGVTLLLAICKLQNLSYHKPSLWQSKMVMEDPSSFLTRLLDQDILVLRWAQPYPMMMTPNSGLSWWLPCLPVTGMLVYQKKLETTTYPPTVETSAGFTCAAPSRAKQMRSSKDAGS